MQIEILAAIDHTGNARDADDFVEVVADGLRDMAQNVERADPGSFCPCSTVRSTPTLPANLSTPSSPGSLSGNEQQIVDLQ